MDGVASFEGAVLSRSPTVLGVRFLLCGSAWWVACLISFVVPRCKHEGPSMSSAIAKLGPRKRSLAMSRQSTSPWRNWAVHGKAAAAKNVIIFAKRKRRRERDMRSSW